MRLKPKRKAEESILEDEERKFETLDVPIDQIEENPWNPNVQTDEEFNMLCDNIKEVGMVGSIMVARLAPEKYRVTEGAHRFRAAKVLGIKTIRCDVFDKSVMNEDEQKAQTMRMNIIRGKMDPIKFTKLYQEMNKRYDDGILRAMMGFTDRAGFEKLYQDIKKSLPAELAAELEKSKDELKTIADLTLVLNSLFTKYGSELKYNFMTFVHGGKEHVMIQCSKDLWGQVYRIKEYCKEKKVDINEIFEILVNSTSTGDAITIVSQKLYDKEEKWKSAK